jgi:hypothetical protein
MGKRRLLRWSCVFFAVTLFPACGEAKSLATKVDDLLKAGKYAAASEELRIGMPKLVKSGKIGELEDVYTTLNRRLPEVRPTADPVLVRGVARSSVSGYFESLVGDASEFPLDDICKSVVENSTPAWDPSQSFTDWLNDRARRQNAAKFCALLKLI